MAARMTKNIIKGIITSIVGMITMIVTLFLVLTKSMDFVWEGIAGLTFGTILLLSPDTIIKKLGDVIGIIGMNKSGSTAANAEQKIEDDKVKKDI